MLQAAQETGQCFTQTDALDGERNFKSKLSLAKTQGHLAELLSGLKLRFNVPLPTPDIYDFKGQIEYNEDASKSLNDSQVKESDDL